MLVVISGPSGVGKGTVHARVREAVPDAVLSVSLTTRPPRPMERDGVDYHFVDREAFERAIAEGRLLEWAPYAGHLYGTPREPVEREIAGGKVVLLDLELQGALRVKDARPEALTIALVPPSMAELERRLRARATEDDDALERRLAVVRAQQDQWQQFDAVVVNDDLDRCVAEVVSRIEAAR